MSRAIRRTLDREVRNRAGHRCEYCHLPQGCVPFAHEIDHVVARQHRGPTAADNLALCCAKCNRHKGTNLSAVDPVTGRITPLFNPRVHEWVEHFQWQGVELHPLSEIGRATIEPLAINSARRVDLRRQLADSGEFPRDFE